MCGVEVSGLLVGIVVFLHHADHRDGNSGHQAWQQAPQTLSHLVCLDILV